MKAIDKLLAAVPERRELETELLGKVYSKPMTVEMRDKINKNVEKSGNKYSMFVYAIIFMLEDKEGEKLFSLEDKKKLSASIPDSIITDLGAFCFSYVDGEDEEAKN